MIDCVVHFSGGLMSFGAAKLAVDKYGADKTVLLFADTGSESDDTYKFVLQTASFLGARLEIVRCMLDDSRAYVRAWDLFLHKKLIATWKYGICTDSLKRRPLNRWVKENAPDAVNIIGFSIEEQERIDRLRRVRPDIKWEFPLAERPYTDPCTIGAWLTKANIAAPKAYATGYSHNNCGGACFKMGKSGWARLLETDPDLFAFHERKEREFREATGKNYSIHRIDDPSSPKGWRNYTLEELRADYEAGHIKPKELTILPCACGILWDPAEDSKPLPLGWDD